MDSPGARDGRLSTQSSPVSPHRHRLSADDYKISSKAAALLGQDVLLVRNLDTGEMVPMEDLLKEVDEENEHLDHVEDGKEKEAAGLENGEERENETAAPTPRVSVNDLRVGDLLVVRGSNAVSLSQYVVSLFNFSSETQGNPEAIHVVMVVDRSTDLAKVAHVVREGSFIDFVIAPIPLSGDSNDPEWEIFHADVFRLRGAERQKIARAAAYHAKELVKSDRISFSTSGSLLSAFRDPDMFNPNQWEKDLEGFLDPEHKLELFCCDFVGMFFSSSSS